MDTYYASWIYSAVNHFVIHQRLIDIVDIIKRLIDITPAIKTFFSTSGIHEFHKDASVIIMRDGDSAFRDDNRDENQIFKKY